MNYKDIKYKKWLALLAFSQITILLVYLNANIVNVGEMGTALPVLVCYVVLSAFLVSLLWLQKRLYIRLHFIVFLLLIVWISLRIVIDRGDMEYLKQITVATTGGMLLFYLAGAAGGVTFHCILAKDKKVWPERLVLLIFTALLIWMLFNFLQRLHPSLFYLSGVDGSYQRSGNFLSISFITISFFYLSSSLKIISDAGNIIFSAFWISLYTASTAIALLGSQLFGSNSATAVILGVYLVTLVMSLVVKDKVLWRYHIEKKLALPFSKRLLNRTFSMVVLGGGGVFVLFFVVIFGLGFDITSIRLFGFGDGTNSSIQSRINILLNEGAKQLSYAPFLGNIEVAYHTDGRMLHSFFPYVMANLGLVGLSIVLALFFCVFLGLYREAKVEQSAGTLSYHACMVPLYSSFLLIYLIFFANLATGVSWIVLWFLVGFVSKPFGFK